MGRPSKGNRHRVGIRLTPILHQQVTDEATRRGMTVNDWVAWALRTSLAPSRRRTTTKEVRDDG